MGFQATGFVAEIVGITNPGAAYLWSIQMIAYSHLKQIEYGVYGDLTMILRKATFFLLQGNYRVFWRLWLIACSGPALFSPMNTLIRTQHIP